VPLRKGRKQKLKAVVDANNHLIITFETGKGSHPDSSRNGDVDDQAAAKIPL
jgi:hypothetical protein